MNYIELINNFWELDEQWQFTCCETRLYFYLVKTANRLGWVDNWTHSDVKASANVGVSENSLKTARNKLIQSGLIDFKAGGKYRGDKNRYQILIPKPTPNHDPYRPPNHDPKPTPLNKHKLNETIKPPVCPPVEDDSSAAEPKFNEIEFVNKVVAYFNEQCKNLTPVKIITKPRRAAVMARYREHGKEAIQIAIEKASRSKFMSGQSAKGWVADFDWIFKPGNFVKTFEGKFDDNSRPNGQQANYNGSTSGIKPGGKLASAMQGLAEDIDALSNKYSQ